MSENTAPLALPPIARKPHRKSRLGCRTCKRRRIKCNEVHPVCGNCAKHQLPCDFSIANPVTSPTQQENMGSGSIPTPPAYTTAVVSPAHQISYTPPVIPATPPIQLSTAFTALNPTDLYLWHHFFQHTYLTFNPTAASPVFWQQILPSLGFSHHYILHLLLGISALHLSRLSPAHHTTYHTLASHHHSTALQAITPALATLNPSTSEPLYAAAVLICFSTLAKGPVDGEYVAFSSSNEDAQWLILLRGVRNIHEHENGGEGLHTGMIQALTSTSPDAVQPRVGPVPDFRPPLRKLREFLVEGRRDGKMELDQEVRVYLTALDSLWRAFISVYEDTERANMGYSIGIFAWLYQAEEEFTKCLKSHRPFALVILSYFTVLMRELESQWFMHGWVDHVLKGVRGFLSEEYWEWTDWPVAWARTVRVDSQNGL